MRSTGARRAPIDPRLWHRARAFRWWVACSAVIGLCITACLIAQATFLSEAITEVFSHHDGTGSIRLALAGLVAATVARAVLAFAAEQSATGAARRTKTELRAAAIGALVALGPTGTARLHTGDLAITLGHGLDALDEYIGRYLPRLVLAVLAPILLVGWIAHLDLISAGILVITLVLLPVFMVLVGQLTEERLAARWSSLASLSGQFLDALEGLATLRAFGRARVQRATIARASDELRQATLATLKVAFLSALVLETLAAVGTALVAVPLGLRLLSGEMLLAPALAILVLTPEVYLPLRRASADFHASTDGLAALDAVFAVLDAAETGPAGGAARSGLQVTGGAGRLVQPDRSLQARATSSERRPSYRLPSPSEVATRPCTGPPVVELRHVLVRYPDRDVVALGPLDLTVGAGEHLAVVGPSGVGKTTLVNLLAGLLLPGQGTVLADGAEVTGSGLAAWRLRLAWVPQRPTLFSGTVADNLRLGAPLAPDRDLWDALEVACLAEVVAALPGGLRARLAEHAETLSAGERQRLALARALVRRGTDFVLLDEPSAHLDPATETELTARLRPALEGRGLLVVTHRPRPLELADRVITLEAGRFRQVLSKRQMKKVTDSADPVSAQPGLIGSNEPLAAG